MFALVLLYIFIGLVNNSHPHILPFLSIQYDLVSRGKDTHTRYPYYEHAGDANASEPFWWLASTIDTTR